MKISITEVCTGTAAYEQVWQLREEILRRPLGLSLKDEDPAEEANDITLAAEVNDHITGCVMLRHKDQKTVKLRQMAVAAEVQGHGVGKALVVSAEEWARTNGYSAIVLHARKTAVPFYEKLGYAVSGDEFTEVGIPHVLMQKNRL
ncbi:GNAT family N-acetyltransferase [Chitinophagaceae bacterium MMS25-I14]